MVVGVKYRQNLYDQLILYKNVLIYVAATPIVKIKEYLWAVSKNKAISAVPVMFKTLFDLINTYKVLFVLNMVSEVDLWA